ncbi:hypothetical protein M440DRAFT_1405072 [Trichoderma longibrachiatum ATCC 18648]|uniref:Uncharacterized protein n=1 Tax=Trichoderma longibrachiatum ATCC 18648 TaxID=983965 RepID=A0A2T4BTR6_TRILO|nr:hypothetical protein M440DRAFT_1405072 [Trichoderma longibrachiatum ATCC 18648]
MSSVRNTSSPLSSQPSITINRDLIIRHSPTNCTMLAYGPAPFKVRRTTLFHRTASGSPAACAGSMLVGTLLDSITSPNSLSIESIPWRVPASMHLDARLPRQSVLSASKALPGQRPENQLNTTWVADGAMCAGACTLYLLGAEPCKCRRISFCL